MNCMESVECEEVSVKNQNGKTDFVPRTKKIWHRFCLMNVNDKNKIKLSNHHCFICFITFISIINVVAPG